ncbi:hypothetical protein [Acinetobacter pittii]|uniref:hypothetical protein n=1 Tax=Acinetobacter pittii TaxID=48296 RepID=UPI001023EF26|nr:hypothetical protein [Acinetobacter pittii]RZG83475.1 hypothetical protein EXE06_08275 [Acinetobacter pittii]RZH54655.1 hypothetical protein EXD88_11485 [Acinetobacter pittii]RZH60116.1 hypothetical protein EXD90_09455 [Acinetobacter pittii]
MLDFFQSLRPFEKEDILDFLQDKSQLRPQMADVWIIKNEIKPVDLFCYLYAKFGPPRGLLTMLRNPDLGSENLIQWDWMFNTDLGPLFIQGHNFRTEVHISEKIKQSGLEATDFVKQLKSDFKNFGKEISNIKKSLEKWTEFVNPFFRIKTTIHQHFLKLEELKLDLDKDKISNIFDLEDQNIWVNITDKYYFAIGLIYGLRSMLPVMAESFINCLIFLTCKPEIKNNSRLFDSIIRQQIDIKVQSLHLNCLYFTSHIDYTSDECKKFHTLMNERNDLLHGNINVSKQAFGDVYFNKDMAIYDSYKDHWEKSIGILIDSVKFDSIYEDLKVVEKFIEFILSHLDPKVSEQTKRVLNNAFLGFNQKSGRVGMLFSDHLADFKLGPIKT